MYLYLCIFYVIHVIKLCVNTKSCHQMEGARPLQILSILYNYSVRPDTYVFKSPDCQTFVCIHLPFSVICCRRQKWHKLFEWPSYIYGVLIWLYWPSLNNFGMYFDIHFSLSVNIRSFVRNFRPELIAVFVTLSELFSRRMLQIIGLWRAHHFLIVADFWKWYEDVNEGGGWGWGAMKCLQCWVPQQKSPCHINDLAFWKIVLHKCRLSDPLPPPYPQPTSSILHCSNNEP